MSKVWKIKDFIKSFFYYPKMRKYFRNRKMEQYDIWKTAIKYAWCHCHVGKMKDYTNKLLNNILEKDEWKAIYRQETIERKNMKLFNPFKRIKQLETQIDVLEGILEDKYRLIERHIKLVKKLEKSLNEHGIHMVTKPKTIFTGRGDYLRTGDFAIVIDTTEHDRKVLEDSKHE